MSDLFKVHPASFRDPAGFIYRSEEQIFRFVSKTYASDYDLLLSSNLAKELIEEGILLPFEESKAQISGRTDHYKTLLPEQIPFFSYPAEWCFSQLKEAALLTLNLCLKALNKGMILKDATPLNIQFVNGRLVWIDHLSFERYEKGKPWAAYRQFCECLLNPLLIASYTTIPCHRLYAAYPSGIPAETTAGLLPFKTKWNLSIFLHVHLQAKVKKKAVKQGESAQTKPISQQSLKQILQSLQQCISSLEERKEKTEWKDYYEEGILNQKYLDKKKELITNILNSKNYSSLLDLGANDGSFALLGKNDARIIAADMDNNCIDKLYRTCRERSLPITPLITDLMHPSPASGWMNREQPSFLDRAKTDICLALALIHHLCIGKNVPFSLAAEMMSNCSSTLIIEFVPKQDPKARLLLANREDIFPSYSEEGFEIAFTTYFNIEEKLPIEGSDRLLYVMKKKN